MARYIDAKVLTNKIKEVYLPSDNLTAGILYDLIKNAPAADVVEVRHGEWSNKYRSGMKVNYGLGGTKPNDT